MNNKCNSCEYFIKRNKDNFTAFDYMVGNNFGVCNYTEDVTPIQWVDDEDCNYTKIES